MQYSQVELIATGTYHFTQKNNTMEPPKFCKHIYRRGYIFAFNESFDYDSTVEYGIAIL